MVQLAERMEQDVAAFEQGLHGKRPARDAFATGVVSLAEIMARAGLQFLKDMVDGKLPQPPMCATLGFHLAEVADGYPASRACRNSATTIRSAPSTAASPRRC